MKTELHPFYRFFRACVTRVNDRAFGVISEKSFGEYYAEINRDFPLDRIYGFKSEESGCVNIVDTESSINTFHWYTPEEKTRDLIAGFTWSGLFVVGDVSEIVVNSCVARVVYGFERIDFDGGFMLLPLVLNNQKEMIRWTKNS